MASRADRRIARHHGELAHDAARYSSANWATGNAEVQATNEGARKMTTIEDFRATRKWCEDLGAALKDGRWDYEAKPATGYLYCNGQLYIEQNADGRFMLVIGSMDWIDSLDALETRLFRFAQTEGYLE